jgi:ABC-type nitrate/sulfonate/bicarbonate transport system substrate-binding protein/outer membrane protein OmpA-like peptidoglycan-associated protein
MRHFALFLMLTLVLCSSAALAAPKTVPFQPFVQKVRVAVENVPDGGALTIPLITWGADIQTIYANGNAQTTAKGSLFEQNGIRAKLVREDNFVKQVENYLAGKTPFLRGTMGMLNMAAEVLAKDKRTAPILIYQLSWSTGGDCLVAKDNIKTAKDLKGKTIALQAYGPHIDYLANILDAAGLSPADVKLLWLPDLTGTENTPPAALYDQGVDAAMVIIPDALALTSNGTVGTGAEASVRGAKILLSTKTANRVIADVYAVRSDYYNSHRDQVEKFVHALLKAEEGMNKLVAEKTTQVAEYRQMIGAAAEILLDSPQAIADAESLLGDMQMVGYTGNVDFFVSPNYPRSMKKLSQEIQTSFLTAGIIGSKTTLAGPGWDFAKLQQGLFNVTKTGAPKFDTQQVAALVTKRQQQGTLAEGELFNFEIFFKPNQTEFTTDLYEKEFSQVVKLASTYGGAIITVEGHSDPLGFLKRKKAGETAVVLNQIRQSAKNLSVSRAATVRDAVIAAAGQQGISLDPSQFAVTGHGITNPRSGMCGADPCPPKTEQEWLSNMRVVFRIVQVEAEADVFKPL